MDASKYLVLRPEPVDVRKYTTIAEKLSMLTGVEYTSFTRHALVFALN